MSEGSPSRMITPLLADLPFHGKIGFAGHAKRGAAMLTDLHQQTIFAAAISPGQQDAFAGDAGLAQAQAKAVQRTAIFPHGM